MLDFVVTVIKHVPIMDLMLSQVTANYIELS